ncbi:hypothetical protein B0T26DRAFT_679316 [Lasiosphaeria miniovina]|uniref:Protein kinase domain-containing protein n=1 Tax=Lasiosphaeria miniovina TaxID=1954250 RepID=A0AA40A662_9PEZI|nr:uncharacterized protein B0T26DRAFT_679316 [Lasiosphaeria miniovina]KAK0709977.1 hypothetical protein B0T26DRAFT_679316 [Lasiosphaeria miniovina]
MSVELALGIVATVDLCFKYGKELRDVCSTFKHADAQISERVLRLENGWLRITHQLNFLRRVSDMMDDDHRKVYDQTLQMFLSKLQIVTSMLKDMHVEKRPSAGTFGPERDTFDTCYKTRRFKYARKKESLDKAIEELETWQRTADLSWFLLMLIANPKVDSALATPEDEDNASLSSTAVSIPSTVTIRAGLDDRFSLASSTATNLGLALPPEELRKMYVSPISYCDATLLARRYSSTGDVTLYLLNRIECQPLSKYRIIKKDTRDLARKLQHDEPHTFGLLSCKGFVTETTADAAAAASAAGPESGLPQGSGSGFTMLPTHDITFTMVFRAPPGSGAARPCTLREKLTSTPAPDSLTDRFEIARGLAKAVGYVHTFGFVHKSVRPESVICFDTKISEPMSEKDYTSGARQSVFLVGFENFRRDEGQTHRKGDDATHKNLYRHPSRQGASPREHYVMQHDIYSLGVCLLEVGLWTSFVKYPAPPSSAVDAAETGRIATRPKVFAGTGIPDEMALPRLSSAVFGGIKLPSRTLEEPQAAGQWLKASGKEFLLGLTREQLPRCMGTRYAEIVETCLTCLDAENADFGDEREFEDQDGILVGVRYIEKVVLRLSMLNV